MIILDTNTVSEISARNPDTQVVEWLASLQSGTALTSITVAELYFGVEILPTGRRKAEQKQITEGIIDRYRETTFHFDTRAAKVYGRISAQRRKMGRPISVADAMIAAICLVNDLALATRNTRDFEHLDLKLVNPWEA
ncbi:MAG: type II toxin-antitoxin system VapC family toxin [Propionibacteriaceae bacterium]|jgi:predicted nucleic acid-binding protein|nr:type II toxin-antitoxin system VapC family toxin [Propionibacteriaceae bacterium]